MHPTGEPALTDLLVTPEQMALYRRRLRAAQEQAATYMSAELAEAKQRWAKAGEGRGLGQ